MGSGCCDPLPVHCAVVERFRILGRIRPFAAVGVCLTFAVEDLVRDCGHHSGLGNWLGACSTATTTTQEVDQILADLCALYESECVTMQACLRHGNPVACATMDELTVTGVLSGPVWRIARAAGR
jgi:hypothetical protein